MPNTSASQLLNQAIEQFDIELIEANENKATLKQAIIEIDDANEQNNNLIDKINEQDTLISLQNKKIAEQQKLLLLAEKVAHEKMALDKKSIVMQEQIKSLQQSITASNGPDSPKRLRTLIKNQKAQAIKTNGRVDTLTKEAKKHRTDLKEVEGKLNKAIDKIRTLTKELNHNTGAGIYHKGPHHLIIWPEKTVMLRPDGSHYESRSLLYMHQSGCGKLINFDPELGESAMAKTPSNGLRPTKEIEEFAKNWLFKVNSLQGGIVTDIDMLNVNHNADLKPKEL